nr:glycosyltransferase [Paracoccus sp. Z118]
MEPLKVTLERDWGHVLELQASRSFSGVLLRNGVPEFPVHLAAGHNVLRLPLSFLTGTTAEVEIRDASGIQRVWRDWLQPPRQLTSLDHLQTEACPPVPVELFPQLGYRYAALRAHCSGGSPPATLAQLDTVIRRLEAGPERCSLGSLAFPEVEDPEVSIVIPAHGKVSTTFYCLNALLLAWNQASFEVILVDDASPDETSHIEEFVSGIRVVRNEEPQRFIRACNAGVAAARGRYVVLLNNDTEPTTGWLDALIDRFDRDPTTGLAGSRLIYPDGRLQEAGGIVWGAGDPWNYGRLGNPNDPRFTYARQVDYVSGAALMTTRALWDEVGGLSDYLEPMYFEDTDLAFKIRAAGSTVWYVPASTVYHFEGVTSGTDTGSGFKRFQEVNRPKFKRRWVRDYASHGTYGVAPDLEKDRNIFGRILFIDYTTPTPDRDAGSYAAMREIELMQSLGFKVTLLPENLAWVGGYTKALQNQGVEVITAPFYESVDAFLETRASEFDAFYVMRYHVVNNVVPKIRELCPAARIVMNGADLHYLRLLRKGLADGDSNSLAEARNVRVAEFEAMRSVDAVVSYNDVEMAVIEAMSEGEVRAMKCPWVLDFPKVIVPRSDRKGLSFFGGFQHHPNVEGLRWFVDQVMEPLNEVCPGLELSIYGSRMGQDVRALESPTIRPIGYVEDVESAYDPHLVFVAPLLSGAGIKGKVLNALARGIPCVLSPLAAEGIGLRHGHDCLIADTPDDWIRAISRLIEDADLWTQVRDNAHNLARERFGVDTAREQMRKVFEAVDLYGKT